MISVHTMQQESIDLANRQVLQMMSNYLNNAPDYIKGDVLLDIASSCNVTKEYAYAVLLAAACGLEVDEKPWDTMLFQEYFLPMLHILPIQDYLMNPYYQRIKVPHKTCGKFELTQKGYQPYEAFVCNDLVHKPDGQILPQIGYFDQTFLYPAVLEEGRIWMTITPNEIETMKLPIQKAHGKVLTFGLGLGYYAFMVSEKPEVTEVTIVDSSEDVISLFINSILPQFPHMDKIRIVNADAYEYARTHYPNHSSDFVFTDLWHDVSDGTASYLTMKKFEPLCSHAEFAYWIEDSIRCYL